MVRTQGSALLSGLVLAVAALSSPVAAEAGQGSSIIQPIPVDDSKALVARKLAPYKVLRTYGDDRFFQGDDIKVVAFRPDGQQFAVGTSGRVRKARLTVWNREGRRQKDLPLAILAAQYSPDGKMLYVLTKGGGLRSYDTATWTARAETTLNVGPHTTLRLAPRDRLVVLGRKHDLRVLDARTLKLKASHPLPERRRVGISPDASLLLVHTRTRLGKDTIEIRETLTGRSLASFGHRAPEGHAVFAFSQDNRLLAVSADRGLSIRNLRTGKVTLLLRPAGPRPGHKGIRVRHENINGLTFSRDAGLLVATSTTGGLYLFDAKKAKLLQRLHVREPWGAVLSPDEKTLVLRGESLGMRVRRYRVPGLEPLAPPHGTYGSGEIHFTPDGKQFVSICENYKMRVFDADSGKVVATLQHNYPINDVAFLHDGSKMTTADNLKKVCVWDTRSWQLDRTLSRHRSFVKSLALDPTGKILYSGDRDGVLIAWEVGSYRELYRLALSKQRHPEIYGIAVATNRLVLSTSAATAEVFDLKTKKRIAILAVMSRPDDPGMYYIRAIAFSPDERVLATVSHDGIIYLWHSATLRPLRTIPGKRCPLQRVAFTPDGRYVMTTGRIGLHIYEAKTGKLVFVYDKQWVSNAGATTLRDGTLTLTIGTDGYTARKLAIRLDEAE